MRPQGSQPSRLRPARHPGRRFVAVSLAAGVVLAGMLLPVAGGVALGARDAARSFESLPSALDTPPLPQRSVILAKDGSTIAVVYAQNRISVPLNEISPVMRQAMVAIEDSRYYEHGGVDLRGTLRALQRNTQSGGVREGGSTITQQYVKQTLIANARTSQERRDASSRTISRKLREMRYSVALEKKYTKDEILERYLNTVYFGDGAYGVQAASQRYFGVDARRLTLGQAATLAGIVQQPVGFNPRLNTARSQVRRNIVLSRMADLGMITPAQAIKAGGIPLSRDLNITETTNGCTTSYAAFFCDYVLRFIANDPYYGKTTADREALLRRGGLTIRTTLDPALQRAAQKAVDRNIPRDDPSRKATAVSSVQPGTGAILAMAQNRLWGTKGRGYTTVNFNVNTEYGGSLGAQAGSTFKVFVLAAALDKGIPITTGIYSPGTRTFNGFTDCTTGQPFPSYTVSNSTGSGYFTMRTATAESVNTYFVALERRTGLCRPRAIAQALGVRRATGEPLRRIPSFVLGSQAVSPLSMAEAYATFAARGIHCRALPIADVIDRNGASVGAPPNDCQQVIKPAVADAVNQLLTSVMTIGTGRKLSIGRPVAGKTGTTDKNAAVWFIGHTPQLATAVWIGDPRGGNRFPIRDITINGRFITKGFGGLLAGPIWQSVMKEGMKGLPVEQFTKPDPSQIAGLTTVVPDVRGLDPATALAQLASAGLKTTLAEYRVQSLQPENTVAYTYPGAGSSVTSGRPVVIYLSDGTIVAPPLPITPLTTTPVPLTPAPPSPRVTPGGR